MRLESNNKGQVTGNLYSGIHWDTLEATMLADGSATLTIRYLHMTMNGEAITGLELELRWLQIAGGFRKALLREPCGHLLRDYRI